jgi:hypothetical protein
MIDRNNKRKTLALHQHYLEKAGLDIGLVHKDSPGCFNYSLLILDYKTWHKFIYGLLDVMSEDIHNASLTFIIEADGIPGTIQ